MPRIIRAEYLSYYNPARNNDKLFNIFLIQETDGTFTCLTENGRRGSILVRRTLCTKARRETAEAKLRQKLDDKRYHRETPYTDEPFGFNYSQLASEYDYNSDQMQNNNVDLNRTNQNSASRNTIEPELNVISFPTEKEEIQRNKPKQIGILNKEQFDSLEI